MKVEWEDSNLCVESLSGLAQYIVSGSVRNCYCYVMCGSEQDLGVTRSESAPGGNSALLPTGVVE